MYEGHNISPTSKGSLRALLGPVVKGNCAIRAVSDRAGMVKELLHIVSW